MDLAQVGGHRALVFLLGDACSVMVIGWPAEEVKTDVGIYFKPVMQFDDPAQCWKLLPVVDLEEWIAMSYDLVCPIEVASKLYEAEKPSEMTGASWVLRMPTSDVLRLSRVLAEHCFFDAELTLLVQLCKYYGLGDASGRSRCEVIKILCEKVIVGIEPEHLLKILSAGVVDGEDHAREALLEMEPILDCLDRDEKEAMEKENVREIAKSDSRRQFCADYWKFKRDLLKLPARIPTGRTNASSPFYKMKKFPEIPIGAITQQEAKQLLPPKSYIWQGTGGTWQSHMPPHKRFSQSWTNGGHRQACLANIKNCWQLFLQDNLMPLSACPVKDLFPAIG